MPSASGGDLDARLRHVGELDRVVRVGPHRVGEILADLALDDVERGRELDVTDVIPAEVHVHQAGHELVVVCVLVVLAALEQRVGAVADADDRDADLAVVDARAPVRASVLDMSLFVCDCSARERRAVGESRRMTSFALSRAATPRVDLVPAPAAGAGLRGFHLLAPCGDAGRRVGRRSVREDADGDVVEVRGSPRGLADECPLQGAGILTRMPARFSVVLAAKLLAL
jgi:hypothetical protein